MSDTTPSSGSPVTAIFARVVKPGRADEFAQWTEGITAAARRFEGFSGTDVLSSSDHDHPEHVTILHFDTYHHLKQWLDSDVRSEWLERVEPLVEGEMQLRVTSGLEYWFMLPDKPEGPPPPRYKQAVVTWLALLPLVYFLPPLFGSLLTGWPAFVVTMIGTGVIVLLMTYLVMPFMTRLFSPWLFSQAPE